MLEHGTEPGLLEVAVGGEGIGQPAGRHDREGNAIGQRLFLVWTCCEEVEPGLINGRVVPDHLKERIVPNSL